MEKRNVSLKLEGFELVGEIYLPEQKGPSPALCLCHGIPRGTPEPGDPGYPALAQRFSSAGFVTLIFNFRGTGQSGGNFDILGWTRDLEAALEYLADMREVDSDRISLMGFSGGAAVSVFVASKERRVSSVVACACPAQFGGAIIVPERASLTIEHFRNIGLIRDEGFPASVADWIDGFNKIKPVEQVERLSPRPLLIIHGAQDDVVDPRDAWALYHSAGEPKEILVVEGAGHRLRLAEEAMAGALSWLRAKAFGDN